MCLVCGLFLLDAGFILGTPSKVYHFLASSSEEKTEWFATLHSHIFTQKRLFQKVSLTSLSMAVLYGIPSIIDVWGNIGTL